MNANFKVFDAVCKTPVITLVSINPTQNQSQDVQHVLLHHDNKINPDQVKSVWENEANRFCCDPQQGQGQWKQLKKKKRLKPINGPYKHGRYEKKLVEQFVCNIQCYGFSYVRRPVEHY